MLHRLRSGLPSTLAAVAALLVLPAGAAAANPQVRDIAPAAGATDVFRDQAVTAEVVVATAGHGVDASTLTAGVSLTGPNGAVSVKLNTSGGGDVISATPRELLASNTTYTFRVTGALKDTAGASFDAASSSFTTGTRTGAVSTDVRFTKSAQAEREKGLFKSFSSLVVGPDHRLYAGTLTGEILRFPINGDGSLGAPTSIDTIRRLEGGDARHVIGLAFAPSSTPANLVLWVSHGDGAFEDAPNWTGKISRLSGDDLRNGTTYVEGLPRSIRDHETNSVAFKGSDLYISQGSLSAMGDWDKSWARDEVLLSAAILKLDASGVMDYENRTGRPLNVKTQDGGSYDPFAPGALLTLYATGVRNGFDLLFHSNGQLYVPTNGSAAGGNMPKVPSTRPSSCPYNPSDPDARGGGPTSMPAQTDFLFRVRQGRYYGHPNPVRCEYVAYGGDETGGDDTGWDVRGYGDSRVYPVGTKPERNWEAPVADMGEHASANGLVEYKSGFWNGQLKGALLITRYSAQDDVMAVQLNADGTVKRQLVGIPGLTGFDNPLDIAQDETNGNLYVSELPVYDPKNPAAYNPRIILLRPDAPSTPGPTPRPTPRPTAPPVATPGPIAPPTATPEPGLIPQGTPLPTPGGGAPLPTASPRPMTAPSTPGPNTPGGPPSGGAGADAPTVVFGTTPRRVGKRSLGLSCRLLEERAGDTRCRVLVTLGKRISGRKLAVKRVKFKGRSAKAVATIGSKDWSKAARWGVTVRIYLLDTDGKTKLATEQAFVSRDDLRRSSKRSTSKGRR